MNNLLNYVPGFRSRKIWKMIIATLYYIISLTSLTDSLGLFLTMVIFPFFIFGLGGLIKYRNKKALINFIIPLIIFMLGTSITPPAIEVSEEAIQPAIVESNQSIIDTNENIIDTETIAANTQSSNTVDTATPTIPEIQGNLEVHFIDVGQADSILIKTPTGKNMLIDAGNNADGDLVKSYIANQGLSTIDVLVGTHPHEDHIGGLDTVINNFNIGKVYMPKVSHTTQTFEDVLLAIQNKGLKVTTPISGDTFVLGDSNFTILAPNSSGYEDLNNNSIVLKMNYGDTSFLFTGDSEDISENEMINKVYDLSVDLLKVGHHGSDSSTTQGFLDKVNPKYAIIMVGSDNSYGHPTSTVLERLKTKGIEVYRTDENGTVIATSNGTNITFNTVPGTYTSGQSNPSSIESDPVAPTPVAPPPTTSEPKPEVQQVPIENTVYITNTGSKYHRDGCRHLSKSKHPISQSDAIEQGYGACSVCY